MRLKKHVGRVITFVVILVYILTAFSMPSFAQGTEKQKVRISCGINNALWLDENGEAQGYCKDYLLSLAKINNWEYEYVPGDWLQSEHRLENGEIDILFPTQKTDARLETMEFPKLAGGHQSISLCAKNDSDYYYDDYSAFNGARIAVTENTYNYTALCDYAEKNNFSFTPVFINSTAAKLEALKNGDVDLIVFSVLNDAPECKIVATLDVQAFYYTVRKGNSELLSKLNSGMQKMIIEQPSILTELDRNYIRGGENSAKWAFSRDENDFIKSGKTIKVGFYDDTIPMAEVMSDGSYSGIYIDILNQISENTGVKIELYPITRDKYGLDLLRDGTVDFVIGSSDKALEMQANNDLVCTDAIMEYYTVAVTKSDYSFSDGNKPNFVLTEARRYWEEYIENEFPGAQITYCQSAKDCLKAVAAGKADITLLNTNEYNYQSKNERFKDLIEWDSYRFMSNMVMVASDKSDARMVSVINKAISRLSENTIRRIVNYHLNKPYEMSDLSDTLYSMQTGLAVSGAVVLLSAAALIYILKTRRKTLEEVENKNRQLMAANSAKTDFLSRMSHDLRTPMNAIIGLSALTVDDADDPKIVRENMSKMRSAGDFMLSLINDILDMAKIEDGSVTLNYEPYEYNAFLINMQTMFEAQCRAKGLGLHISVPKMNPIVMADKIRINQIFFNVFSNAVKYTPENGDIYYSVENLQIKDNILSCDGVIRDTGIGMSEEYQKRLFEPFAQEDTRVTPELQGSGLGLSITKSLVELMGGNIKITSRKNEGTTVTIHLSFELVTSDAESCEETAIKQETVSTAVLHNKNVLLAEDHPLNAQIARKLLEKEKMHVVHAENGKIAVELFEGSPQNTFDIILMDIRMPEMTGLEASKAIRALDREDAKTIPIVAMTANAYAEDILQSKAAGMNAHLAKPVEPILLYETISKFLSK